uniref:Uncharacterized protein n=1 Tax=Anguilla anguilla TaxID=7936 RepID=A0A0E9SPM2_ANGAN
MLSLPVEVILKIPKKSAPLASKDKCLNSKYLTVKH